MWFTKLNKNQLSVTKYTPTEIKLHGEDGNKKWKKTLKKRIY